MKIILNVSQFDDGNLTVEANIFQKPSTSLLTRGRLVSRPCRGLAGRFQNTHKICLRRSKQKTHEHVCSTQISAMKIDWCLTARNVSEDPVVLRVRTEQTLVPVFLPCLGHTAQGIMASLENSESKATYRCVGN